MFLNFRNGKPSKFILSGQYNPETEVRQRYHKKRKQKNIGQHS